MAAEMTGTLGTMISNRKHFSINRRTDLDQKRQQCNGKRYRKRYMQNENSTENDQPGYKEDEDLDLLGDDDVFDDIEKIYHRNSGFGKL